MELDELKNKLVSNEHLWAKYKYINPLKIHYFVETEKSKKPKILPKHYNYWNLYDNILFNLKEGQLIYVLDIDKNILNNNFIKVDKKIQKLNNDKITKPIKVLKNIRKDLTINYIADNKTLNRLNSKYINIKFHRLLCLEYLYTNKSQHFMRCICDCGEKP